MWGQPPSAVPPGAARQVFAGHDTKCARYLSRTQATMELQFNLEGDSFWTATAIFPSWKGFQNRSGAYASRGSSTPSDGSARIIFAPEGRGIEPLTDSEKSLLRWVIENDGSVSVALIASLLKEYPSLQEQ